MSKCKTMSAPTNVDAQATSNTTIDVEWTPSTGFFLVEYLPNVYTPFIVNDDKYTITGLTPNTLYSIRVALIILPATFYWSGYVNVTTLQNAPTGLTAISYQNLAVKLSWTAPNDGGSPITDYVVQYSTDQILWTTFPHSPSNATTITVTGLTNGTFYYFKVAAVNSIGVGVYSTVTNATPSMVTSCGITGFVPAPPPWSRAGGNNCPNCDSNYGTSACGSNGMPYSTYALDERRKTEILKYKKNGAQMSKAQQYSMLSRNALTRKKSWATQTQTYTNPNVDKLPERESEGATVALECIQPNVLYSLTSDCDVPGPVIPLYIDAKIPLYNYKMQVTPSSGGKQVNKMFAIT